MEERLRTNSSNSSKPPSSDPPSHKPPKSKQRKKSRRRPGGQPGHKGTTRALLPPEEVDEFISCEPASRCDCGGRILCDHEDPLRVQNVELLQIHTMVREFLLHSGRCQRCGQVHIAELPPGTPPGILGPRAMAVVAVLTGKYHLSKRQAAELLKDLLGLEVSVGTISNTEGRVSAALERPVEEAKTYVQQQAVVHADETGHKVAGKKAWVWTAVTELVAVFLIRTTRGAVAAKELLGETFKGILVSDRWSGYGWVPVKRRQLCWAHLIRDFKKIAERGGSSQEVGNAILEYVHKMFRLWRRYRQGQCSRKQLQRKMMPIRRSIEGLLEEGQVCGHPKTQRTCSRILKKKVALWTFIRVPGVEPTNNLAERMVRPYVLWRKSSFGTQSTRGNTFVERILTVSATCRLQKRNVLEYVTAAVEAHLEERAAPSLLPQRESLALARALG